VRDRRQSLPQKEDSDFDSTTLV